MATFTGLEVENEFTRKNGQWPRVLITPHSGKTSATVEIIDSPLVIYAFDFTQNTSIEINAIGPQGQEVPYKYKNKIYSITLDNNPLILRVSGRYKLNVVGPDRPTLIAYQQRVGVDKSAIEQPYAASIQRPNALFDANSTSEWSKVIEVISRATVIQAFGLVDTTEVQIYNVYGNGGTEQTTPFRINAASRNLDQDNNTTILDSTGRYKFRLTADIGDVYVVAMPQGVAFNETSSSVVPTGGDLHYVHEQSVPSSTWSIIHNLGKYPSASVVDSAGSNVEGYVIYDSTNAITLSFNGAFSGVAYLN